LRESLVMVARILRLLGSVLLAALVLSTASQVAADGIVKGPAEYKGSLEETSQEAVIIVTSAREGGPATEELILKISVEGEVNHFAWVIPFPNQPTANEADAKLF
jgi:hypothetical protein